MHQTQSLLQILTSNGLANIQLSNFIFKSTEIAHIDFFSISPRCNFIPTPTVLHQAHAVEKNYQCIKTKRELTLEPLLVFLNSGGISYVSWLRATGNCFGQCHILHNFVKPLHDRSTRLRPPSHIVCSDRIRLTRDWTLARSLIASYM